MERLAWRFAGRLPSMTKESNGTVLSWHGDLLVPRPTFLDFFVLLFLPVQTEERVCAISFLSFLLFLFRFFFLISI